MNFKTLFSVVRTTLLATTLLAATHLALAQAEPDRIKVLNAGKSQSEVAAEAWRLVREVLWD